MKNSIKKFLQFNEKTIYFLAKDGQYWIALRPICEALTVNWNRQFQNLKDHNVFGQLFAEQQMVAADNKLRKMICLPERYVYGWIFQINSTSKELANYQRECCDILYNHFHGIIGNRREIFKEQLDLKQQITQMKKALEEIPEYNLLLKLEGRLKLTGKSLKDLDEVLIYEQMDLFSSSID